ncbi:hypothetical protein [Actinokineospora sp. NBRC 105648]|uniref:hypothetical protein n=1 Tax=Actinokineospora sp. NBRC 105648 TaxID=3032206 RepID=UPI0024A1984D|nr:hypothetical protein [Actinokineospora sp. NBRC 105648]GLZ41243.1 hypothetical protein Acsp05_48670 [Actinokineospora sp. NBRC 105648]
MNVDQELRRLFADDRLDVPAKAGAAEAVVAGAHRVRRRRVAAGAAGGAVLAALLVTGGVVLAGMGSASQLPPAGPGLPTATPTAQTTIAPTEPSDALRYPTAGATDPPSIPASR